MSTACQPGSLGCRGNSSVPEWVAPELSTVFKCSAWLSFLTYPHELGRCHLYGRRVLPCLLAGRGVIADRSRGRALMMLDRKSHIAEDLLCSYSAI